MIEPVWLSAETVIYINEEVVRETGEPPFLRDRGLLESAVAKAINRFHYEGVEDVVSLATTLLFGLARNHPFEQGNKRTGFSPQSSSSKPMATPSNRTLRSRSPPPLSTCSKEG